MSTLPDDSPPDQTTRISNPPPWAHGGGAAVPPRVGDFEIVSKLGQGAFGQVFLAHQVSLGRHVALKVTDREMAGRSEGQLLAGLEHDHIVKVFSAFADPDTGLAGLCLQYVPGADLGVLIRHLYEGGRQPQSGAELLAALDRLRRGDPGFDPAALRDREALGADEFPQAVCRLGARLAEALAFAHARGVLHCDIKPGNILITPYGRPMLADFNVAFDRTRHRDGVRYGGTLAYMAPEYYAAMAGLPGGAADERCDVYSLGVVLYELATGRRPPRLAPPPESPEPGGPDALDRVPRELAAVIRRTLRPDPADRYSSAAELAAALGAAGRLMAARRELPAPTPLDRRVGARPALALALAGILPHAAASVVQIGYNLVEVNLSAAQGMVFERLLWAYNLVVYPTCGGIGLWLFWRITRKLPVVGALSGPQLDALRGEVRRIGARSAVLGAVGWLPGALVFPVAIDVLAGPLGWQTYAHYFVSFALAGLIGCVFSYLCITYVVFRALYPHLGNPDAFAPAAARAEVQPLTAPLGALMTLACAVPLVGAVLLLTLADGVLTLGFRVLTVGLIGAGVAGVGIAERIVRRTRRLAAVWLTGPA
ncbi:Serine/threonine-protein kinase StkP [Gemmata obscuriglobus]|uniref:Protein kinase domain-containing protein n=1 Tax=Gemmata obscuriglobus TaxID=114 RepID=A0A2Z3HC37_9BACT|nr:serine/threonine-protein kinase [Gemmata obscuriglobus]AWM40545.1 hypothetical protein C1280_28565 [Gemmata obscuriglobus]QEG26200.1 Serine/threonine-protein kinase StkP [Gemmata obscuriglobus]VTS00887.1 protein kinase : Putative serine/threonine protein kinase OS=Nocardia nova SH22a GN=NONO_c35600 PE=3 SV=1: Pkinase: Pkinase [Gemmata obscuriglobus UQM 2246]